MNKILSSSRRSPASVAAVPAAVNNHSDSGAFNRALENRKQAARNNNNSSANKTIDAGLRNHSVEVEVPVVNGNNHTSKPLQSGFQAKEQALASRNDAEDRISRDNDASCEANSNGNGSAVGLFSSPPRPKDGPHGADRESGPDNMPTALVAGAAPFPPAGENAGLAADLSHRAMTLNDFSTVLSELQQQQTPAADKQWSFAIKDSGLPLAAVRLASKVPGHWMLTLAVEDDDPMLLQDYTDRLHKKLTANGRQIEGIEIVQGYTP